MQKSFELAVHEDNKKATVASSNIYSGAKVLIFPHIPILFAQFLFYGLIVYLQLIITEGQTPCELNLSDQRTVPWSYLSLHHPLPATFNIHPLTGLAIEEATLEVVIYIV